MSSIGRVTVTLPMDLVRNIDRLEKNRSKFVADAVRNEIQRRQREELRRSLQNPHPESGAVDDGIRVWALSLPEEDPDLLVDSHKAKSVRWVAGEGWVEES